MIQITQLKLPYHHSAVELENKIRKCLRLSGNQKFTYRIVKKSLDARKKPELFLVYSVHVVCDNEAGIVKKTKNASVSIVKPRHYQLPSTGEQELTAPPLIIGAGPAGLFAAFVLAEAGFHPILIERGKAVEERQKDVEKFWETGILDTSSNVQFGEGGAGTFSDGKLNTVVKDPANRNQFVLETFVRFGAPEQILYENKPHIGTEILCDVIKNMRNYLLEKGVEIHFETCAKEFVIENKQIKAVVCENGKTFSTSAVILAVGHSARDTFQTLHDLEIPMEAKNFAVGFRVEHPQEMINEALYGKQNQDMPAAPYKVTSNFPNGRGVYSFCMCPGGYVVNSSSEEEMLVVNGMSYSGRNSSTANSAIIISVGEADFINPFFFQGDCEHLLQKKDALSGMRFQQALEKKAYQLALGKIPQQLYGDFCENKCSTSYGAFESNTKGNTAFVNLRGVFSEEMEESFMGGMEHFAHIIPGFDREDAILSGVESRTSSPIRILRNENYESEVKGIYPCGEGAGFAGGITSAAMDGIRVAEAIIQKYKPN
ncbi:MAG: FAD-dependent monooxygenase [Agathobacter sp.]|nr:FAD-dependent monooxygenase [Agathobacter sp.]